MKTAFLILTLYVSWLQADDLPILGNPRKVERIDLHSLLPSSLSNARNVRVKVETYRAQEVDDSGNPIPVNTLQYQNTIKNESEGISFLPLDSGISLDSSNFFDQNLHEPGSHSPPYPIIPVGTSNKKLNIKSPYPFVTGFSSSGEGSNQGLPISSIPQSFDAQSNVNSNNFNAQPLNIQSNGYLDTSTGYNEATFQSFKGNGFSNSLSHETERNQQSNFDYDTQKNPVVPQYFLNQDGNRPINAVQLPLDSRPTIDGFLQKPLIQNQTFVSGNRNQVIPSQSAQELEEILRAEWAEFMTKYSKVYASSEEERFRREVYLENRAKIQRLNMDYAEGRRNYVHRINPYADMLLNEFNTQFCGFNRSRSMPRNPIKQATAFVPSANVVFPDSVDWRQVGAVGPVRTQGKCAACWAFAAAGALEGHHFRKTGNLVNVSVQNLIDCTEPYGNSGCSGGLMDPAFEYVRDNNGVDSEESYPFEERTAECRFNRENVVATCTGFVDIGENDEKGLEIALATLGPVTAAIDASKETFQFYSDGVYDDPECGNEPSKMNHAVLIVGFGTEPDGKKYWLVKNSYGPQWGMGGYIKIAKENGNQCGIAIQASYPLV